jgi:predicted membrane chloride channel (bestrophin family)
MPDAVLTSVVVLILAPILFPLGVVLLVPAAMLLVPVIPVFALVGLATLLVLAARSRQPGTDSAPGWTQALIDTRSLLRQLSPLRPDAQGSQHGRSAIRATL